MGGVPGEGEAPSCWQAAARAAQMLMGWRGLEPSLQQSRELRAQVSFYPQLIKLMRENLFPPTMGRC